MGNMLMVPTTDVKHTGHISVCTAHAMAELIQVACLLCTNIANTSKPANKSIN
jgi:hypothetical protein